MIPELATIDFWFQWLIQTPKGSLLEPVQSPGLFALFCCPNGWNLLPWIFLKNVSDVSHTNRIFSDSWDPVSEIVGIFGNFGKNLCCQVFLRISHHNSMFFLIWHTEEVIEDQLGVKRLGHHALYCISAALELVTRFHPEWQELMA